MGKVIRPRENRLVHKSCFAPRGQPPTEWCCSKARKRAQSITMLMSLHT
jgi:hypothetical protein